ncbi:hypothetical protein HYV43_07285 [Candidatus Micrarchaeota archaeon]|nr:hypothetical protein [Candidatus Micrarchaeota archaeon]
MRPLLILVALSVVVILGVVAYPYLVPGNSSLSREQAVAFVLDDVRPLESQGVEARVVQVRSVDGKWTVDVLLSRGAHSACPIVDKRAYTLSPIGYRSEPVLASCAAPVSIDYREEALIASAALLPSLGAGAYGCAFHWERFDAVEATAYCPPLDAARLTSFAEGLPSSTWLVQWNDGGSTRWVALSPRGQLLKSA